MSKTPSKLSTLSLKSATGSQISQKRVLRPPYFKPSPLFRDHDENELKNPPTKTITNQKIYERFSKYHTKTKDESETTSSSPKEFQISLNDVNSNVIQDKDEQISITYFNGSSSDSEDPSIILASDTQNEHYQIPPNSPIFNVKTSFLRESKTESKSSDKNQIKINRTLEMALSPKKELTTNKNGCQIDDSINKSIARVTFALPDDYERKQCMNFNFLKDLEEEEIIDQDPRILSPKIPPLSKRLSEPTDFCIIPRRSNKSNNQSPSSSPKNKQRPRYMPYGNSPSPSKKPKSNGIKEKKTNSNPENDNRETNQELHLSMLENEPLSEFLRVEQSLQEVPSKRNIDLNYLKILQIVRSRLQRTPEFPAVAKILSKNQSNHFLLLLTHPCLQLDGIYVTFESEAKKIYGVGPQMFTARQVDTFWLYNVNSQGFDIVETKNFNRGVDAVAIQY